jgi:glutamate carboxypeptidase
MPILRSHPLRLACLVCLVAPRATLWSQSSATLSSIERSVTRAVDSHNAEALSLLERLVNINSGTLNLAGVRQVGDVLRAQFDTLGFKTRWVDGAAFQRAGHLVAEHPGPGQRYSSSGTSIRSSNRTIHFRNFNASTIRPRGPGVIDMKGGDVVLLFALRALKDAGMLEKMNVTVVFNGDEERLALRRSRSQNADRCGEGDAALGLRDGAGDPKTAVISRRVLDRGRCDDRYAGPFRTDLQPEVGAEGLRSVTSTVLHRLSNEQYPPSIPAWPSAARS